MELDNSGENDIIIDADESDSEEIPLTAAEVIERMEEAWLNEKFSPEILPNKSEILECLLGQISYMEENLQNLNSNDFQKSLHQMEIDRLRFVITSYLRTRLEKIETYVYLILKKEEERLENNQQQYLTDNELEFAKSYKDTIGSMICDGGDSSKKELVIIRYPDPYRTCIHTEIPSTKGFCWKDVIKTGLEQHFEEILRFWPGLQPDEWKKNPVTPNISSFVFAKAKAAIEGVMLDDANDDEEALVDLQNGSQMIISYNSISQLVKNDEVCLI